LGLQLTAAHPVRIVLDPGESSIIYNNSGAVVYYGTTQWVSPTVNLGSITAGSSATVTTSVFIISASLSDVAWSDPALPASGGTSLPTRVVTLPGGSLTAGTTDGELAEVRIGAWPNQHVERFVWDATNSKWIGQAKTVLTQDDTHGMNLDHKALADLRDWSRVTAPLPYDRLFNITTGTQTANAATINVASTTSYRGGAFPTSGQLRILDNIIAYTGTTGTTFTGCSLVVTGKAGAGGTIPVGTNVLGQGASIGGYGLVTAPVIEVATMWTAGFRLQEHLTSFLCGAAGSPSPVMQLAPYWWQYDSTDGRINPDLTVPPTGSVGRGVTIASDASVVNNPKTAGPERAFKWTESGWLDWSAGTPTKKYLQPVLFAKMVDVTATDTGECCDTALRVRWVK
jgi:hypothetical protein